MDERHLTPPAAILLAVAVDAAFGEPANVAHPVAWLGRLITALRDRRPIDDPARELLYGAGMAVATVGVAGGAGLLAQRGLRRLPPPARVVATALALKPAFAFRALTDAAVVVRRALDDEDLDAARAGLPALVSRDPGLDEAHVVSAVVESLAENLTDSVVAPLLAFAAGGLPAAWSYRAVNTLDAMIGYHGEYEYAGKAAARLDDVANYLPARLTGLLLCACGGARCRRAARVMLASRRAGSGPNPMWTIGAMAGVLGVRVEKPGEYAVGDPGRSCTPELIDEAVRFVRRGGLAVVVLAAVVASRRRIP